MILKQQILEPPHCVSVSKDRRNVCCPTTTQIPITNPQSSRCYDRMNNCDFNDSRTWINLHHLLTSIVIVLSVAMASTTLPFVPTVDAVTSKYSSLNLLNNNRNYERSDSLHVSKVHKNRQKVLSTTMKSILTRRQLTTPLLLNRGGATTTDDDDEMDDDTDDDDIDDDDDDMLLDFDNDDDDGQMSNDNDFGETTMIDRLMVAYTKTPPVTKLYLSISLAITLYGYLFTKNEFPSILLLQWDKVLTRLQFWRILTSFFHFGPFGIGYIMTLQFVWVYMSTLERIHHNRPYDFWIMILFGQLCMVIGYPIMKLSPKTLGHNLSTFLVYIWSRYHEGQEVNMFELFNTRAELLPWFFLGQTFLLEGEVPLLDCLGILFGHIYHHCKTVGILRAPPQLTEWYENSDAAKQIRELYKPISSDFDVPI